MRTNGVLKNSLSRIIGLVLLLETIFCFHSLAQEKPKPLPIDSFNYSNSEDASLRIDMWRNELHNSPQSIGYIIIYGGKTGKKGEVEAHLRGIRQAVRLKGIDKNRVTVSKGGFRENLTVEFWILPIGSNFPMLTPTVDIKKVRFSGISPRIIAYECCF